MKKTLLIGAFLIGSFFTVNAQVTSFETSQGYTLGNIAGQNGWTVTTAPVLATVSSDYSAGGGTNSLKIAGNNGTNHALAAAFSPVAAVNGATISVSMDIYFTTVSATSCDFQVLIQSPSQQKVAARVNFNYQGNILILDSSPTPTDPLALAYIDSGDDFVAGQWYNFRVVIESATNSINYYLNNALIYTGVRFGATNVEQIVLANDNYNSTAYFDNIQYTSGALGVKEINASKLSVYPNPTSGLVTISNDDNSALQSVSITDLNGRTVKSLKLNGETSSQINISDLSAGVYMMNISSDQGSVTRKIVKN